MAAPKQRDLVVYMYLNTVTELVYIGSSLYGLEHRHRRHKKAAVQKKHKSRFYRALLDWPDELWVRVVLERCSTEEELDAAETQWIAECCALDSGVGYNTYDSRYLRSAIAGGKAMQAKEWSPAERAELAARGRLGGQRANQLGAHPKSAKRLEQERKRAEFAAMTEDQRREYFRECGRRGAAKSKLVTR